MSEESNLTGCEKPRFWQKLRMWIISVFSKKPDDSELNAEPVLSDNSI